MLQKLILDSVEGTRKVLDLVLADDVLISAVAKAGELCIEALKQNRKILVAGNGGSAADSQHIAAELVSRLNYDRPGLSSIALTTDTSALTAIGNDYGFDRVFARQLEAIGQEGDVFIAISTSGNSGNVLAAIESARAKGIKVIGMTGQGGGKMEALCDIILKMPSSRTPNIQECHIMFGHIICQIIEDGMFGKEYGPAKA
ncbi:MAG TPA: D-sedoheptulose 7-phosphate isomerase [Rickettsiales bacterium]|nr:D-sedoheptulose 7-phosphate isomerase [Rickettsiales bacterium]